MSPDLMHCVRGECTVSEAYDLIRLASRQAQARQQQVLGLAQKQIARHDQRGNGAQQGNDRARFVEPSHMGIAGGKSAVCVGKTRLVLNGQEQVRRHLRQTDV
jgi:hypothetical protein